MPELTAEEYDALKADIQERGVMVPIEFDEDGNCLDGHHRLRICQELGIKDYPTVIRAGMDEVEKFRHAWYLNTSRRSLTNEQKRESIAKLIIETGFSDREIGRITGASQVTVASIRRQVSPTVHLEQLETRVDLLNKQTRTTEGMDGKSRPMNADEAKKQQDKIQILLEENPERSNSDIARKTGASPSTVASQRKKWVTSFNPSKRDAKALKDPDIQRRLAEDDKMNVAGAIREQKRDQLVEHLESVETREAKAVQGVYDVVVIDPPWPMERIESDANPHAVYMDYPTMTLEEIKGLKIPAADDCHVFLWTTQKYLPSSFDVFKAWGVKYVCCFVWHKNQGHKPFGLPKYNCEFCLYGHIGSPVFVEETQFWACIEAPITVHSEKPEKFYEMIRHVTAGRRLDMFNRREIEGFETWGKEAD